MGSGGRGGRKKLVAGVAAGGSNNLLGLMSLNPPKKLTSRESAISLFFRRDGGSAQNYFRRPASPNDWGGGPRMTPN